MQLHAHVSADQVTGSVLIRAHQCAGGGTADGRVARVSFSASRINSG